MLQFSILQKFCDGLKNEKVSWFWKPQFGTTFYHCIRIGRAEGTGRGAGGYLPHQILAAQLTLFQQRGQIMLTTLLLVPPDFRTFLRPWYKYMMGGQNHSPQGSRRTHNETSSSSHHFFCDFSPKLGLSSVHKISHFTY